MNHFIHNSQSHYHPSSSLFRYPSVFKQMSRIVDLFALLDEYKYSSSEKLADHASIRRDYDITLKRLEKAFEEYNEEETNGKITEDARA